MQVLDKGYVVLVSHMGDDRTVVNAARVSFNKQVSELSEKDEKLIKYLYINRHTSPFEHVTFTFEIKCPLFVARQWMRHRTWSYNEISRRYTSDEIDFYIPHELRKQADSDRQASTDVVVDFGNVYPRSIIYEHSYSSLALYRSLLLKGVAREQARMVLPQNMYTTFYATVNLHNLFHFLTLRNSEHAQYEIRVYADALEEIIKDVVPISYQVYRGET